MNAFVELFEHIHKGNIVLFCGSDISEDGGTLNDNQIAREIANRINVDCDDKLTLQEIAQTYELQASKQSLVSLLTDLVLDGGRQPVRFHHLIASLPFNRIITTNWDNRLEDALIQEGKRYVKVVSDEDIGYINEDNVTVFKLRGSIERKDTIVITSNDYYDLLFHTPEMSNLIRAYFSSKTLLFIGYDFIDENFRQVYHNVVRHLGLHKRRAFAVGNSFAPSIIQYCQLKNIATIEMNVIEFLENLVEELAAEAINWAQSDDRNIKSGLISDGIKYRKGVMDYEVGLHALKNYAIDTEWYADYLQFEARLQENLRDERSYGPAQQTSQDRSRIIEQLNALTLNRIGVSFNSLCYRSVISRTK
jgi:hypothetical protein